MGLRPCLHKVDVSIAAHRRLHGVQGGWRRCLVYICHEDAGAFLRQAAAYCQANTVCAACTA
jgi:hypothetical protein